jgi:hypothetical protein
MLNSKAPSGYWFQMQEKHRHLGYLSFQLALTALIFPNEKTKKQGFI